MGPFALRYRVGAYLPFAALLAATAAAPLPAQNGVPHVPVAAGGAGAASCVPDTTSTVRQLVLGVEVDQNLDPQSRARAATIAKRLATFVDPPSRLTIDKLRGPSDWTDPTGTYHSDGLLSVGQILLELDTAGRAAGARLDPGTGSPEVDRALLDGVATAQGSGFVLDSAASRGGLRRVRLWLVTAEAPTASWATPLFRVAGRVLAHASPPTIRSQPAPVYPAAQHGQGIEGDVTLTFVVDEEGQVPDESIRVVSADHQAFVEPAIQSIRESRFDAATQGRCPVRATMRQRVSFRAPSGTVAPTPAPNRPTPAPNRDSVLAEAGRWLARTMPTLTRKNALLSMSGGRSSGRATLGWSGSADLLRARTRVTKANLERCTLLLQRLFEIEPYDLQSAFRMTQTVPLDRVDLATVRVTRDPPSGEDGLFAINLGKQDWRVAADLRDGSITADWQVGARYGGRWQGVALDLSVTNREAAVQIAEQLARAVQACQPS